MNAIGHTLRTGAAAALLVGLAAQAAPPIVVDDADPGAVASGTWLAATGASSHNGPGSLYALTGGAVASVTFTPDLPSAGTYRVEAWNSCFSPRSTAVPHEIVSDDVTSPVTVFVDQDSGTGICGQWEELGTFPFAAGTGGSVTISDAGVVDAPYIGADAVRFTNLATFSVDFAETDGTNLILQASGLDDTATTTVEMAWPLDEPCPAGGSCDSTELTVGSVAGSTVTAALPAGLVPGSYVVTLVNGTESAQITYAVGAPGFVVNGTTNAGDLLSFDGSSWVSRRPGDLTYGKDNMQPWLGLHCIIAMVGVYPSRNAADPLLGEVIYFAGNFPPRGWAFCDGQLLPISQNSALFSLLGTTYGGDGRTTFGLPGMRGRVPVHPGQGPGLTRRSWGERDGVEQH